MKKFLVVVADLYEELELWYPVLRMKEAGFEVTIAGEKKEHLYLGKHGYPCKADLAFSEMKSSYDGILIPGGFAPDKLRRVPQVLELTAHLFSKGKIIAFICHGGWVPISARILKGKKVTGTVAIKDDLENAGGIWQDLPVVRDGNLISSRNPLDLPYFAKAIVESL